MNTRSVALALAAFTAAGWYSNSRASEVPPGEPAVRVSQIAVTNPTGAGVDVDVTADYPLYEDVILVHTNVTREVKPGGGYQWKTNIWRTVERRKTGYSVPRTPIASFTAGPGLTVVSNVAAKVDIMEGMRVFADISDPRVVARISYAVAVSDGGVDPAAFEIVSNAAARAASIELVKTGYRALGDLSVYVPKATNPPAEIVWKTLDESLALAIAGSGEGIYWSGTAWVFGNGGAYGGWIPTYSDPFISDRSATVQEWTWVREDDASVRAKAIVALVPDKDDTDAVAKKSDVRSAKSEILYERPVGRTHDILPCDPVVEYADKTHVRVLGDILVAVGETPVYIREDVLVDRGTVTGGSDYAVVVNAATNVAVVPYDSAAVDATVRILGGFHTICRDVPTTTTKAPSVVFGDTPHELAGWVAGDILPKSVWAMNFRPSCDDPTGMVYVKECDVWVDIYNASGSIYAPKSKFGGTRLHTKTQVAFMTGFGNVGKQLLNDEEFWYAALGSNCGSKVKGEAQSNPDTTGGHLDTANYPMVSSIGCEEMCGLQSQWLRDTHANSGGSWDMSANPTVAYDGNNNAFGSMYGMANYRAAYAGGAWPSTVAAIGPLFRAAVDARSRVYVDIGGRGSSRSLHTVKRP